MDAALLFPAGVEAQVQSARFPRARLDDLGAPERRLHGYEPRSARVGVRGKVRSQREPRRLALQMDPEEGSRRSGEGEGEGAAREGHDPAHFPADETRDFRDPGHGFRRRVRLFSASTYPGWIWSARR